jgi:hypothetical protein
MKVGSLGDRSKMSDNRKATITAIVYAAERGYKGAKFGDAKVKRNTFSTKEEWLAYNYIYNLIKKRK